jgi:hypothetical protein
MEFAMDINKILILLTILSIMASIIYGYLFFSKRTVYNRIKNKIIRITIKTLTYILFIVLPIFVVGLGIGIFGIFSFLVLFVLIIIGIIFILRKYHVDLRRNNGI